MRHEEDYNTEEAEFNLRLNDILNQENVAELLDGKQLDYVGNLVVEEFNQDKESRTEWENNMEDARKLALQITEEKNFPWPGASNVTFPLVTIAAMQFQARVYPEVVKGAEVVQMRSYGKDEAGEKHSQALRVQNHMNYQMLEEDDKWEEEHDRALMVLPILGCVFKKTYFDPLKGHIVSEHVLPHDLVVPYYAKSLEDAARKTQVVPMYHKDIKERQLLGIYLDDVDLGAPRREEDPHKRNQQDQKGLRPPTQDRDKPRDIIEQHRFLDLDGDDYPEPYIVTVDLSSGKVLRIVARFIESGIQTNVDNEIQEIEDHVAEVLEQMSPESEGVFEFVKEQRERIQELRNRSFVIRISPEEYFTKYSFIPSPDGSFYDIGFGLLLGPVNRSVNTIINQLVDSGTLQNSAGGFIGRGVSMRGGKMRFEPFEWKRVDVAGGDLAQNIFPLPVNQPSSVLFQLLNLLINYGERMSAVSDLMQGVTPGQNTPATTSMAALEQGQKVFSSIYKRVYRGMKSEFKKVFYLNSLYLEGLESFYILDTGETDTIHPEDYRTFQGIILPSADPFVESSELRMQRAQFLAERAQMVPGYNTTEVERRLLKEMNIEGKQTVFPVDEEGNPQIQPPTDPEMEIKIAEEERRLAETQARVQKLNFETERDMLKLDVEIAKIEAETILALAKAQSEEQKHELEKLKTHLDFMKERREELDTILQHTREEEKLENDRAQQERDPGMAGQPADPAHDAGRGERGPAPDGPTG